MTRQRPAPVLAARAVLNDVISVGRCAKQTCWMCSNGALFQCKQCPNDSAWWCDEHSKYHAENAPEHHTHSYVCQNCFCNVATQFCDIECDSPYKFFCSHCSTVLGNHFGAVSHPLVPVASPGSSAAPMIVLNDDSDDVNGGSATRRHNRATSPMSPENSLRGVPLSNTDWEAAFTTVVGRPIHEDDVLATVTDWVADGVSGVRDPSQGEVAALCGLLETCIKRKRMDVALGALRRFRRALQKAWRWSQTSDYAYTAPAQPQWRSAFNVSLMTTQSFVESSYSIPMSDMMGLLLPLSPAGSP